MLFHRRHSEPVHGKTRAIDASLATAGDCDVYLTRPLSRRLERFLPGLGERVRIVSGNPSANPVLQMDENGGWSMGAGPLVITYPLTGRSRAIVEEELGGTAE